MTEQEWLACNDPMSMLESLPDGVSQRRGWLFLVACYRAWWLTGSSWFTPRTNKERQTHEQALLALEQRADGAPWSALHIRGNPLLQMLTELAVLTGDSAAAAALRDAANPVNPSGDLPSIMRFIAHHTCLSDFTYPRKDVAALIRELVGNPFSTPRVELAWLNWAGDVVRNMARVTYDERAFNRISILGDALEDAGCSDRAILDHLRGPGPHVRGCWAIDLLLGKS